MLAIATKVAYILLQGKTYHYIEIYPNQFIGLAMKANRQTVIYRKKNNNP